MTSINATERFIADALTIHGDMYDYSKVVVTTSKAPVKIICRKHGEFEQKPDSHIRLKRGCSKCAGVNKKTTDEFITDAMVVHGEKYLYDKSVYGNAKDNVIITCRIHGEFQQTPSNHLSGQGCPHCGGAATKTTEQYIQEAVAIHGAKYSYTNTVYLGAHRKIKVFCHEHGQEFVQTASNHLTHSCSCKLKSGSTDGFIVVPRKKRGRKKVS